MIGLMDIVVALVVVSVVVMATLFPIVIIVLGCLFSGKSKDKSTTPPNKDIWGASRELPPRSPNKNILG